MHVGTTETERVDRQQIVGQSEERESNLLPLDRYLRMIISLGFLCHHLEAAIDEARNVSVRRCVMQIS